MEHSRLIVYMALKVIVDTGYFDSQVQFRTNCGIMGNTINLFSFTCKLQIGEESKCLSLTSKFPCLIALLKTKIETTKENLLKVEK